MPMRGINQPAMKVPPSAIQKPKTLVTVAMSVFVKPLLEERHRHRARDVAGHAEARDEQQDRDRRRAEPLVEVVDRRPDRFNEAGMRLVGLHIGGRFGRE